MRDVDRAVERATARLDRFPGLFEQHWLDGMRAKLGLFAPEEGDRALVDDLLGWMHERSADFTNTFVSLTAGRPVADAAPADPEFDAWHGRWVARRARQPQSAAEVAGLMRRHNPAVIPRNHHVEAALQAATGDDDLSVTERLLDVLATPYDHDRDLGAFSAPAPDARPYRTFCGDVAQAVASRGLRRNKPERIRSSPAKRPLPVSMMTTSAATSTRFLLTIR